MNNASAHTTLRTLSLQISRRESKIRRLEYERDNHWDKETKRTGPVKEPRYKQINDAILHQKHEIIYLREALTPLAYVIGKDLL